MGRLPDTYRDPNTNQDLPILVRQPYMITGELDVSAGVKDSFPQAQFITDEATAKPLEIHRMIVRLTAFDNGTFANTVLGIGIVSQLYEPQPDVSGMIELKIIDLSRDETVTKNESLVLGLQTANCQTWEWEEPFTVDDLSGFLIDVIPATSFTINAGSATVPSPDEIGVILTIRVEITFEGYLLDLQQPTSPTDQTAK